MPHAQVCSLETPRARLHRVWWMPSSYRGTQTPSHTCGQPTSPPVSTTRLVITLTGRYLNPFLLDGCECYLSSDKDAVLLDVVGMRWFTTLPVGEANWGAIGPFKEHLVPLVVQAYPQHICGHWGAQACVAVPYSCYHISHLILPPLKVSLIHTHTCTRTLTIAWLGKYETLFFYVVNAGQVSSLFVTCSQSIPPHHFIPLQVVAITRIWNPAVGTEDGLVYGWRQGWKYENSGSFRNADA